MAPTLTTRRDFVGSSALAALTLLTTSSAAPSVDVTNLGTNHLSSPPRFAFGSVYSAEEAAEIFVPPRGLDASRRVAMPFWWDGDAKILVNPINVPFSAAITPGDYQLKSEILNFRASQKDLGDVWNKLTNNAQININAGTTLPDGDTLDWIMMTGIEVAAGLFTSKDEKLGALSSNNSSNRPTSLLRPAEAVVFQKGICSLAVTINAQRKKSFWDRLLGAMHSFTNSAVFGVLPIPKLYQSAVAAFTQVLNEVQERKDLLEILSSRAYGFRLYEGAKGDFTFRPGHWVFIDSMFASAFMDQQQNLSNLYLDIGGLLYEVKNRRTGAPIETTYSVVNFDLASTSRPQT